MPPRRPDGAVAAGRGVGRSGIVPWFWRATNPALHRTWRSNLVRPECGTILRAAPASAVVRSLTRRCTEPERARCCITSAVQSRVDSKSVTPPDGQMMELKCASCGRALDRSPFGCCACEAATPPSAASSSDHRAGIALLTLSCLVAWWLTALAASLMCLYAAIRFKREIQRNSSAPLWFWCSTLLTFIWFFIGAWSLYTHVFPPKSVPLLK
ncbi:MAG: hypothetical protein QOK37_4598 [Thermoanaerobaculia bacterium]|nr:hypothetical protein [Thermoanaerobaculia bacterium]